MRIIESYLSENGWSTQREYGDIRNQATNDLPIPARGQWVLRDNAGQVVYTAKNLQDIFSMFDEQTGPMDQMYDIPEGFRRWMGGPTPPFDWDMVLVKFRNGEIGRGRSTGNMDWNRPQTHCTGDMPSDIIAFSVKPIVGVSLDDVRSVGFHWVRVALDTEVTEEWANGPQPAHWNGEKWTLLGIEHPYPVIWIGEPITETAPSMAYKGGKSSDAELSEMAVMFERDSPGFVPVRGH